MDPNGLKINLQATQSVAEKQPPRPCEHLLFYGSLPLCLSFEYCLSALIFPYASPYSFFKQFSAKFLSGFQRPRHQNERKPFPALSQAVQCTLDPMLPCLYPCLYPRGVLGSGKSRRQPGLVPSLVASI